MLSLVSPKIDTNPIYIRPIIGQLLPPDDVPETERKYLAKHLSDWTLDDLPDTIPNLYQLLYTKGTLYLYRNIKRSTSLSTTYLSYRIRYITERDWK